VAALHQLLSDIDSWQILAIAAKTMLYAACFVAGGGALFLQTFSSYVHDREQRQIRQVVAGAAIAGMLFSALHIVVMNGMLSGSWSDAFDLKMTRMILSTAQGPSLCLRVAGLGLIALLASNRIRGRLRFIALLGAVLTTLSLGVVGHASELASETSPIPQLLIFLHLLTVAFWLGALWPLHRLTYHRGIGDIAMVMSRFGKLAIAVVAGLLVAGTLLLWMLLGSIGALWQSAYGQLMLVKLAAVAMLLMLAAFNKLRLTPRLAAGDQSAILAIRKSIVAEITIAAMILLITASITTLLGPPSLN
jgi:putative copper resistance protein D